jgi:hypothetical protein
LWEDNIVEEKEGGERKEGGDSYRKWRGEIGM